MLWLIWSVGLLAAVVLYLREVYSKFERQGVKTEKIVPFFGHMASIVLCREHMAESNARTYFAFPEEKFVGRYIFTKPVLLVRDLELIKNILVKDFDHFEDRNLFFNEKKDALTAKSLISLKGQRWKHVRSTMRTLYTSAKLKQMLPFMLEAGDNLINYIKKNISESRSSSLELDCNDLLLRYAFDTILSYGYGVKLDSQNDRNNILYSLGAAASKRRFEQMIAIYLANSFPSLLKILNITFLSEAFTNVYVKLLRESIENREKSNFMRSDYIHVLKEAKKVMSEDEVVSQGILLLFGSFDNNVLIMSDLLYELALQPDIQNRLASEIKETYAKNGGKFDYNSIMEMKYLDMVVSETLRKYAIGVLGRMCTKDYNIGKPNSLSTKDYIVRKGDNVQIPIWAIHYDPEYHPDPHKFDPERFSDANKHKIKPFTYAPFGVGPRSCIASRFSLCEVKVLACQLLHQIEVLPGPRTTIPFQLRTGTITNDLKGGYWLTYKVRE